MVQEADPQPSLSWEATKKDQGQAGECLAVVNSRSLGDRTQTILRQESHASGMGVFHTAHCCESRAHVPAPTTCVSRWSLLPLAFLP
jgi:hypothetical protein